MSQVNVEIVETAIEVFNRRDIDSSEPRRVHTSRQVGQGKGSGAHFERAVGIVFQVRNGNLWRIRSYLDPTEALEAVGLSE